MLCLARLGQSALWATLCFEMRLTNIRVKKILPHDLVLSTKPSFMAFWVCCSLKDDSSIPSPFFFVVPEKNELPWKFLTTLSLNWSFIAWVGHRYSLQTSVECQCVHGGTRAHVHTGPTHCKRTFVWCFTKTDMIRRWLRHLSTCHTNAMYICAPNRGTFTLGPWLGENIYIQTNKNRTLAFKAHRHTKSFHSRPLSPSAPLPWPIHKR